MSPTRCWSPLFCLAWVSACTGQPSGDGASSSQSSSSSTGGQSSSSVAQSSSQASSTGGGSSSGGAGNVAAGAVLVERLAGLWTGPATRTPLGDFALMNVDFRSVTDRTAFGRVDLDAENNLRFAFWIENHGSADTWIYRNGGYFTGLLRDTRTVLQEHDLASGTWRFCALQGGCAYVDALYDFDGDNALTFDVKVRGNQHVLWSASRLETRELPSPFPATDAPLGGSEVPFPDMPRLEVTVQWTQALAAPADVWVALSVENCNLQAASCNVSRAIKTAADTGATSATVAFEQIHAGPYKAVALVDRNRNIGSVVAPDGVDGVSIPNSPLTVAPTGTTNATLTIFLRP